MSTLKVDAIRHNSATSDAITTASDGTCTAKLTSVGGGQLSHRNLIINGDFQVAQRASSSNNNGYTSVDRWKIESSNITHNSTKSQQSLSSSDTPYTLGFRRFARIALAQAGVVAANSYVEFHHKMEAQNVSNSGWNYNSTSSFITLQFWFRCSTNQTFYAWVTSTDGTNKRFTFSFTASGNNTWTKVTKTIPGASDIQIDNDNEEGFNVVIAPFYGTDYTGSVSLDTWVTKNDATHSPDYASTWLTAGASTFDITGVQLEVGDTATSFEHRSFADELRRCQRYCYVIPYGGNSLNTRFIDNVYGDTKSSSEIQALVTLPAPMRATPTYTGSSTNIELFAGNGSDHFTADGFSNYLTYGGENCQSMSLRKSGASSITDGQSGKFLWRATGGFMKFDAEI